MPQIEPREPSVEPPAPPAAPTSAAIARDWRIVIRDPRLAEIRRQETRWSQSLDGRRI